MRTTLQTLARGARLVELLKQKQFSPRTVEQQVTLIRAGLSGALDKQPMEQDRQDERADPRRARPVH